jgi:uncharacterized protein involved in outer membrane biogenesis
MERLRRVVTGVPFLVTAAAIVLLFLVYTLAGFFLVPRLVKSYAPRFVQEQLKRRLELGDVRLNPLLFKVEIKDFRLQEADGRPLVGFERLFVDFQIASLFRRAWTFANIELDAPRLDVVMAKDGRLNLVDLLESFGPSEPAPEPAPAPMRLLLRHAAIRRGTVSFTDLTGRAPQTATVTPIDVQVQNIATLQDRRGPYAIAATLAGGGVVAWEGEISLVPLQSTGQLELRGFPLATAWRFVQDDYALAEPAGRLDAKLGYELAYRDGTTTLRVSGVDVALAALALTERGQRAPMLSLETVRVTGVRGDLIARELTVPEIAVSRGRLTATMARDGTVNWQRIAVPAAPATPATPPAPAAPPAPATPPAKAPPDKPWRVAIEKVRLDQVALGVIDESRATPLAVDVGELSVGLSAKLETGPGGLAGTADDLGVRIARVAVREAAAAKGSVLSLDDIQLEGGRVDLAAQKVSASRLAVTGGTTTIVRAADGSLALLAMLAPAEQGARPPAAAAARPAGAAARAAAAPAARPWAIALAKIDLADHRVAVTDQTVSPAAQLEVSGIKVSVRDFRTDDTRPVPFEAALDLAKTGRFTASGRAAADGSLAEATLRLARLPLAIAQPYVADMALVQVRSGTASTNGRLTYRAGRDRPAVTYTGVVEVDGVTVVESASGDPVVGWKSMRADRVRFGLAPDRLEIAEVRLTELDGSLVIFKDKSLNVTKLMKSPATPAATPPPATATPPPATATPPPAAPPPAAAQAGPRPSETPAEPAFPVAIERVRIDDSAMNFADLSLVLPFATRVHALNGTIVGLSSKPGSRATMKLAGRVDEFGSVTVDGTIDGYQPKVFTDIAVVFRNVPMSTLSPYSATFAGRRIQAGTMDVNLEYKIERSALLGENKVVLRRLKLGERVESPGAMRLPLDLAIAILSDSNGVIDLELPVRGNVDAPEFSYGGLIWQALVNVISKIATAPFRALAGLFGGRGDGEKLESIAFEAGSDTVPPPERQKLQQVVEILGKRPQLKLTVHGGYEAKVDGEALRSLRVRQDLARRLEVTLKPGEDPGPVAYDDPKVQRALEALLAERAGDKAIDSFEADYEKRTGKKPERVSRVLAMVGRGGGDRAFYEALFRRLVETTQLPEAELKALAQRRGEATVRTLKEAAGTAAARIEVGDSEAAERAERNAVPTRLELGVTGA